MPTPITDQLDLLTTRSTLYQAFERVQENGGCRGCDGETLYTFRRDLERRLDSIQNSLLTRTYRPLPLMRFSVPKPRGGKRWLSVPTVRDRVVQSEKELETPMAVAGEEGESLTFRALFRRQAHRLAGQGAGRASRLLTRRAAGRPAPPGSAAVPAGRLAGDRSAESG